MKTTRIYLEVTGANLELIRFLTDNFELLATRIQDKFVEARNGFTMYFDNPSILERLNKELKWNPEKLTVEIGSWQ